MTEPDWQHDCGRTGLASDLINGKCQCEAEFTDYLEQAVLDEESDDRRNGKN